MRFKEMYIAEFERMRDQIKTGIDLTGLSPQLQLLIAMEHRQLQIEQKQQEHEQQLETIKETFLQRDAFVRKLVDQKVGYLLGKPFGIQTAKPAYYDLLSQFFDKAMMRRQTVAQRTSICRA
jgi:hypothetical protein